MQSQTGSARLGACGFGRIFLQAVQGDNSEISFVPRALAARLLLLSYLSSHAIMHSISNDGRPVAHTKPAPTPAGASKAVCGAAGASSFVVCCGVAVDCASLQLLSWFLMQDSGVPRAIFISSFHTALASTINYRHRACCRSRMQAKHACGMTRTRFHLCTVAHLCAVQQLFVYYLHVLCGLNSQRLCWPTVHSLRLAGCLTFFSAKIGRAHV